MRRLKKRCAECEKKWPRTQTLTFVASELLLELLYRDRRHRFSEQRLQLNEQPLQRNQPVIFGVLLEQQHQVAQIGQISMLLQQTHNHLVDLLTSGLLLPNSLLQDSLTLGPLQLNSQQQDLRILAI